MRLFTFFRVIISFITVMSFLTVGCSKDPVAVITRDIESYKEGNKSSFVDIEKDVIKHASIDSLKKVSLTSNGSVLYKMNGNKLVTVYPLKKSIKLNDEYEDLVISVNEEYTALCDTSRVIVYDNKERTVLNTVIGDTEKPVYAIALRDDNLFYYRDQKLFYQDLTLEKGDEYVTTVFKSPYTKFYNVGLYQCGSFMGILTGIAGSYYFSVVDIPEKSVQVHNIAVSSSKIHMDCDCLYYISGNSGKWKLTRFDFNTKNKDFLKSFTSLVDIEITSTGAVYLDDSGLSVITHKGEKRSIPFQYDLTGKINDSIIMHYDGDLYFVDLEKLMTLLSVVEKQLPGIF